MIEDNKKSSKILRVFNRVLETKEKLQKDREALEDVTTKLELSKPDYKQPAGNARSHKLDRVGHTVEAREKYLEAIKKSKEDALSALVEASKLLSLVEDVKAYSVLSARYIQGKSYEEISDFMNYSSQQIYRFRKKGLQEIEDKLDAAGLPDPEEDPDPKEKCE